MSENKILVALDGSERAFKTIEYLCSFKPFLKKRLVLHNIMAKVPECYYDLEKDPSSYQAGSQVQAWELEYKTSLETFMEKAKTMLLEAGFKPEAIQVIIKERDKGIARDIMDEAQKGYEALLIRRRGGAQSLLPLALGSVSTKLVEKTSGIPVMLAGVQTVSHSLLVAVDGSQGALRAVEFAAKMVENSPCRIVLCSVLRDFDLFDENKRKKKKEEEKQASEIIRTAFEEIETTVREAGEIFENAGIPKTRIVTKIIQGAESRADAIVQAAKEEGCDTLVFGRRGTSDVADFDIGRVPWKVIHGAKEMTVWMVP